MYFGTAVDNPSLQNKGYMNIASDTNEFGQITPVNGQKWKSVEPSRGHYNYANGDDVTAVAKQNGQFLRCHGLLWYRQFPSWGASSNSTLVWALVANLIKHGSS